MLPEYTVYRCKSKKDDSRKGHIHFANNVEFSLITSCGKSLDENWYVVTTHHDGTATCPECNKLHNTKPNAVELLKEKIRKINPDFTEEQVIIKMDEMISELVNLFKIY